MRALQTVVLAVIATLLPSITPAQVDTEGNARLVRKVEPKYTDRALAERIEGVVILRCEIRTDGRAHEIQVTRGLGAGLDERAIEALGKWEFRPALRRGNPIASPAMIEMNFRLPRQ